MANRSKFPSSIDTFIEHYELSASDIPNLLRYQELKLKINRTPSEDDELAALTNKLRDKLFISEDFNKLQDCITALEIFFRDNTIGYLDSLKDQFSYKGLYQSNIQYLKWNMVTYNGNIYQAKIDNIGQIPKGDTTDVYWNLLSRKGDKGDVGLNLNYRGEYNPNFTYDLGDAVTYQYMIYFCKGNGITSIPTTTADWELFDKLFVGDYSPSSPIPSLAWLDTTTKKLKYWNTSLTTPAWTGINSENAEKLGNQPPSYYGKASELGNLSQLITIKKTSLVDAINELKQRSIRGTGVFNGPTGTVINHTKGDLNYTVTVTPTSNPNGFLGEVWVEQSATSFKVCCSGSTKVSFNYHMTW